MSVAVRTPTYEKNKARSVPTWLWS